MLEDGRYSGVSWMAFMMGFVEFAFCILCLPVDLLGSRLGI